MENYFKIGGAATIDNANTDKELVERQTPSMEKARSTQQ